MSGDLNGYVLDFVNRGSTLHLIVNETDINSAVTFGNSSSKMGVLFPFVPTDHGVLEKVKVRVGRTGDVTDKISVSLWSFGAYGTPINSSPSKKVAEVEIPIIGTQFPLYNVSNFDSVGETEIQFDPTPIYKDIQYGLLIQRTGSPGEPSYVFLASGEVTVDSCETVSGWSTTRALAPILNGTTKVQGDYSLDLAWVQDANKKAEYTKSVTPFDGTDKTFFVWFYVTDLDQLDSSPAVRVLVGTSLSHSYYKDYDRSELVLGWNRLGGKISTFNTIGSPAITNLGIISLQFNARSDEIASGQVKMDDWHTQQPYTLDDCEAITGWSGSAGTLGPSSESIHIEGSKSIGLGKQLGTFNWYYTKNINPIDGTNLSYLYVYIYLSSTGLARTTDVTISFGTNSRLNSFAKTFLKSQLNVGWNKLGGLFSDFTTVGSPDITDLNVLSIECNGAFGRIQNDDFTMDWWHIITDTVKEVIEGCEVTTGWAKNVDATVPTLDGTTKKQGLYSINMGKSGTTVNYVYYYKTITQFNGINKDFFVWVYIEDVNDLATTAAAIVYVGEDVSNYYWKQYTRAQLSNGWNKLGGSLPSDFATLGTPDITQLDYLRLAFSTSFSGDTIAHGRLKMDDWHTVFTPTRTTVEDCDSTAGWNTAAAAATPVLDPVKKEGTYSLALGKLITNALPYAVYNKTITPFDGTSEYFFVWVYVTDVDELRQVQSLEMQVGSDASNFYYKVFNQLDLTTGWNLLGGFLPDDFTVNGSPAIAALDFIQLVLYTDENAMVSGDVKMDYWHLGGDGEYWIRNISNQWAVNDNTIAFLKVLAANINSVQNALVSSGSYSDYSNALGFYEILGIPIGSRTFKFEKSGFDPQELSATILNGQLSRLDSALGYTPPPPGPPPPPPPPPPGTIYFGAVRRIVAFGGVPPYTFEFEKDETRGGILQIFEDTIEYIAGYAEGEDIVRVSDSRNNKSTTKFEVVDPRRFRS